MQPCKIVVSRSAPSVSGAVHNEQGAYAGDVLVTLAPTSAELSREPLLFRHVRTEADGRFRIHSLAPGEYRLLAWEDVDLNLAMDPEFRAFFDSRAVTVRLQQRSQGSVTLGLMPQPAIEAAEARLP